MGRAPLFVTSGWRFGGIGLLAVGAEAIERPNGVGFEFDQTCVNQLSAANVKLEVVTTPANQDSRRKIPLPSFIHLIFPQQLFGLQRFTTDA